MMGVASETCRVKETSINCIVASSWHFTLFTRVKMFPKYVGDRLFQCFAFSHVHSEIDSAEDKGGCNGIRILV